MPYFEVVLIVVISIVAAIGLGLLRVLVKHAIDFTMASAVDYAKYALLDDPAFTLKIRLNAKEAVEYLFDKIKEEAIHDPKFTEKLKTNVKEGIEYTVHQVNGHW